MRKIQCSTAMVAALVLLFAALPATAERRWFIQDDDGRIVAMTDDDGAYTPAGTTAVTDATIRAADPPGADGPINFFGFWDGATYTAPPNLLPVIDPTTDQGMVQVAAHAMMHTFETAIAFISENRVAWRPATVAAALDGIHWQLVACTRVALNATRTAAARVKFLEECASWPTDASGDVVTYVDAMDGAAPDALWSWVDPEADPPTRHPIAMAGAGFAGATNIEAAPASSSLIGRRWVVEIP